MVQSQLAWSKERLKYPLFLFLLIFWAKIGYVALESFYNYYVLITTTSPDLNQETLYELKKNGYHGNISINNSLYITLDINLKRQQNQIKELNIRIYHKDPFEQRLLKIYYTIIKNPDIQKKPGIQKTMEEINHIRYNKPTIAGYLQNLT